MMERVSSAAACASHAINNMRGGSWLEIFGLRFQCMDFRQLRGRLVKSVCAQDMFNRHAAQRHVSIEIFSDCSAGQASADSRYTRKGRFSAWLIKAAT